MLRSLSRQLSRSGLLAGLTLALPAVASNGTLYFSEDQNATGLYTLDPLTGAATLVGTTGSIAGNVGLTEGPSPTQLYGSTPIDLTHINTDGSGASPVGALLVEGFAYDPNSGILYGAINGDFATYNPANGAVIAPLAPPVDDVEGLAYGHGGVFGLAQGGELYFYNIGTDSWGLIGLTGVSFDQIGLAYDPIGDLLYAKGNQDSLLYSVDPTTASATVIGNTGRANGGGLAFVPNPSAEVPEASTVLGGGSLAALLLAGALRSRSISRRAAA